MVYINPPHFWHDSAFCDSKRCGVSVRVCRKGGWITKVALGDDSTSDGAMSAPSSSLARKHLLLHRIRPAASVGSAVVVKGSAALIYSLTQAAGDNRKAGKLSTGQCKLSCGAIPPP